MYNLTARIVSVCLSFCLT